MLNINTKESMMVQFEMYFTNEYVKEILTDLANAMKLHFHNEDVEKAMQERDKQSKNNILFVRKDKRFICIDCNDKDWIFSLIVRCGESEAKKVKEIMLKWDNLIREEYDQELTSDMFNVYEKDDNLLKRIEEYYNITL